LIVGLAGIAFFAAVTIFLGASSFTAICFFAIAMALTEVTWRVGAGVAQGACLDPAFKYADAGEKFSKEDPLPVGSLSGLKTRPGAVVSTPSANTFRPSAIVMAMMA
jgi:hypothetical protein